MDSITIDELDEDAFRHSVEDMLRENHVDEAVERLRALLEPFAREGGVLPARFLTVTSADIEIGGWHRLPERVFNHERVGQPISAIAVTLADARVLGGPGPSNGLLSPFVKTFYFSDQAYPFSDATRDDLLDGYSREGFEWQGDYQATDATLSIRGIDDLYGAIVELEDRLFTMLQPDEDAVRAGTIGACYLAALIHQALRDTVRAKGLPRPMCVLAACDGVYPFFDAPVAGTDEVVAAKPEALDEVWPEALEDAMADEDAEAEPAEPAEAPAVEGSLLDLVSRKGTKKPVIVLADEDAAEAMRLTELAGASQLSTEGDDEAPALPPAPLTAGQWIADAPPVAPLGEEPAIEAPATDIAPLAWDAPAEPESPAPTDERTLELPPEPAPTDEMASVPEEAPLPAFAGEDSSLAEAASDDEDAATDFAPVRHSLRARIELAQPEATPSLGERIAAFFRRLFGRG